MSKNATRTGVSSERPTPWEAAPRIWAERYPGAALIIVAGSVVRGEGTATSDLDLVVVFKSLEQPFRESFYFGTWPV